MNANPHRIEMRGHRPTTISSTGKTGTSGLNQWVKIYPVPTPSGNWPTPTCADAFTDKLKSSQQQEGSMHSVNLSQAVKMFPTPTATNTKAVHMRGADNGKEREPRVIQEGGGQLNPDWVEWLMGWPIGHTSMDPLNPEAFRAWLRAFPNVQTALKPSGTDKCQQP
jgi:hypothetical protein